MKRLILLLITALTFASCIEGNDNEFFATGNNAGPNLGTAANDTYDTTINNAVNVTAAGGLLINDSANGTVATFQTPTTQGGTINVNADGSFNYTPPNNFVGADTFIYTTLFPNNISTATVTIRVFPNALFVDNSAANGGTGTLQSRFNTIAGALAAANPGDTIFVFSGNGTNNGLAGPINLQDNQMLIGEGVGLEALGTGLGAPGNFPLFTGPITLGSGCTVRGVRVENAPANAIIGDGSAAGTISDNQISNPGGDGISLQNASGNWDVSRNNINQAGGIGIEATTLGGTVARYTTNNNTITNGAFSAIAFVLSQTSNLTGQVNNNSFTNNGTLVGTIGVIANNTSVGCFDVVGNNSDGTLTFSRNVASATLNVEEFGNLSALNNGATTGSDPGLFPATDVADGFCGF